jgi:hypothetical protein
MPSVHKCDFIKIKVNVKFVYGQNILFNGLHRNPDPHGSAFIFKARSVSPSLIRLAPNTDQHKIDADLKHCQENSDFENK